MKIWKIGVLVEDLKAAEEASDLGLGEIVSEDAAAPEGPGLHLLALSGPHVIASELPEK